jgi:hypothetical protein
VTKWHIERATVFLIIIVVSFLYDLTSWLGIRDPTRFPHPFVIFRSIGDVEFLRGFPGMVRQAIFSLVAGGTIGVAVGFVILKSSWLTHATIRSLRVALWLPFFCIFAVPDTFTIGITAVMLCTIYHYLTAQSLLEIEGKDALLHVAREATLQAIFITLIAQIWTQRWQWMLFAAIQNAGMGFGVLASLVVLLSLINWIFRLRFRELSERCAVYSPKN